MSKMRPMRQRTDAPRQDEGPSTVRRCWPGPFWDWPPTPCFSPCPASRPGCCPPQRWPRPAGVYLGFAVADGRRSALLVQAGELPGFTALAALAVQRDSPGLLGAGWLAHVTWDALHHRGRGPTRVRSWYPPLCIGYDVAVAVPLLTGQL